MQRQVVKIIDGKTVHTYEDRGPGAARPRATKAGGTGVHVGGTKAPPAEDFSVLAKKRKR